MNPNDPAFPTTTRGWLSEPDNAGDQKIILDAEGDLTKREWFAGMALASLVGHPAIEQRGIPWLAEHAVLIADAVIAKLEEAPK